MKMVHSLAIRLIKKGSVISIELNLKGLLDTGMQRFLLKNIGQLKAIEFIKNKMVHSIYFINRFNVLENMDVAND
jgi:hypothetical protein